MSTRCLIGLKNPDNTIKAIYCHYDGYLEGVGEVLLKHYETLEKVQDLLEMGSLRSLEPKVEPCDILDENVSEYYESIEDFSGNNLIEYLYLFDNNVWKYLEINSNKSWETIESYF